MSSDNTHARKGKIARLPAAIRDEVCQRLNDGQTAPRILEWLNAQPETKAVMERHFAGEPVNEMNLSAWRTGGFIDWCEAQQEADRLQGLAELSVKLVEATGLKISDGAAAIAAGNLLSKLETVIDPDEQHQLIQQLVALRAGDHAVHDGQRKDRKLALDEQKARLKEREVILAEEKFRNLLLEKLLETAKRPEVQAILQSTKPRAVKMEQLRLAIFGEVEAA